MKRKDDSVTPSAEPGTQRAEPRAMEDYSQVREPNWGTSNIHPIVFQNCCGPETPFTFILKESVYVFLERGEGREKERERNISWLPLAHPQPGTWAATQARALTRNRTPDLSVSGTTPSPLSHTSQGFTSLSSLLNWNVYSCYPASVSPLNSRYVGGR